MKRKRYQCRLCQHTERWPGSLARHHRLKHGGTKPVKRKKEGLAMMKLEVTAPERVVKGLLTTLVEIPGVTQVNWELESV